MGVLQLFAAVDTLVLGRIRKSFVLEKVTTVPHLCNFHVSSIFGHTMSPETSSTASIENG